MALGFGAAALPPGLMGFVTSEQLRDQSNLGAVQQIAGLTNVQNTRADMAEKERVRGLMAQFPAVMNSGDDKAIVGLLGQIKPELAAQYLLQKSDHGYGTPVKVDTPAGPRYAIPDKRGGMKVTDFTPHDNEHAVGTQMERAVTGLQTLQKKQDAGTPLTPGESMQAQSWRAMLSQTRMQIEPVTQQPYWSQPFTIPDSITVGGAQRAPGPGGVAAPAAAPGAPGAVNRFPDLGTGRRGLDAGTEKKFESLGSSLNQQIPLIEQFDDKFGGFAIPFSGDAAMEMGRRINGKFTDMADWWQRYEAWITDLRAEKFGLSLTGHELAQMHKYRAVASDTPELIKKNLARQREIMEGAISRNLNAVSQSGQNVEQAKALLGLSSGDRDPGDKAAPGAAQPGSIPTDRVTGSPQKEVKRTGTFNGKKVVEYADGTMEYIQ